MEPNPFEGDKIDFIIILLSIVWVIYTADHIMDGYVSKGQSGILRYDYNYKYRWLLIPLCLVFSAIALWLIFKNVDSTFVANGLWLLPTLPIYFYFKHKGFLKPLVKMLIISIVVSTVVVSLYWSETILSDFFKLERIIITLLAFLNIVILEHFEYHEEHKLLQPESGNLYSDIAKRVFIWLIVLLILASYQDLRTWPATISILLAALFLRLILKYATWFSVNRRYRFWADFSLALLWPLLKIFQQIGLWFLATG